MRSASISCHSNRRFSLFMRFGATLPWCWSCPSNKPGATPTIRARRMIEVGSAGSSRNVPGERLGDDHPLRELIRFLLLLRGGVAPVLKEQRVLAVQQEVAGLVEEREPELVVRPVTEAQDDHRFRR